MSQATQQTPSPWHGHPTHAGTHQGVGSMGLVPDAPHTKAAQMELCPVARGHFVLHRRFPLLMGVSKVTHNISPPPASTGKPERQAPAHVEALYFRWKWWAGGAGGTSPLLVWLATSWQAQARMNAPPQLASTHQLPGRLGPTRELAPWVWFLTLPRQKLPRWSSTQLHEAILFSTASFLY